MAKSRVEWLTEFIDEYHRAVANVDKWKGRREFAQQRMLDADRVKEDMKRRIVMYLHMVGTTIYNGKVYSLEGQHYFTVSEVKNVAGREIDGVGGE